MEIKAHHIALAGSTVVITAALHFMAPWEGIRYKAYLDPAKIASVCRGRAHDVDLNKTYTLDECNEMAIEDMENADKFFGRKVKVQTSDNQREAFDDFIYNVGAGHFASSTALQLLNAGEYAEACKAMEVFSCITVDAGTGDTTGPCAKPKINMKYLHQLNRRRDAEVALCLGEIE